MAENSKIEWTDHTFNPWVGCTKVSPACDHCYAEAWAKRTGQPALWQGDRRRTTPANWREPLKWNRRAQIMTHAWAEGVAIHGGDEALCIANGFIKPRRPRVFCASLADVFDNQVPGAWRCDLWDLIHQTPHLDWLLLTKRPQNIAKTLPRRAQGAMADWANGWPNVWLGTTVENQAEADRRIPHLLAVPASKHFLSCEPLLGPADIRLHWLVEHHPGSARIDWIIAGGESGPGARPMHPAWARSLRDQCASAGVSFFFKQWGEFLVGEDAPSDHIRADIAPLVFPDGDEFVVYSDGHDILLCTAQDHRGEPKRIWKEYWASGTGQLLKRIGKTKAGRLLDGREHNEAPR